MKKIMVNDGDVMIAHVVTDGVHGIMLSKMDEKHEPGEIQAKAGVPVKQSVIDDDSTILIEVGNHKSADVLLSKVAYLWTQLKENHWDDKELSE